MRRTRPYHLTVVTQPATTRQQPLTGKGLDLILLASCSCLLTVVCHPVMDAAQATSSARTHGTATASGPTTTMTTQANPTTANWFSTIGQTMPAKRDELTDEE